MSLDAKKFATDVKEVLHRLVDSISVATEGDVAKLREDIDTLGEDAKETGSDAVAAVETTVNETVPAPAGTGTETVDPAPVEVPPKTQAAELPADPLAGLSEDDIRALAAKQLGGGN